MTSSEIIAHQEQTGRLCISLRGMFYTAYNGSAQALAQITGYQVKQTAGSTASSPCCYAGFPASALDRVIARLMPLFEEVFCTESYSCRPGKGTLYGIRRIQTFIAEYRRKHAGNCWVFKGDLQAFFMTIDRRKLLNGLEQLINQRTTQSGGGTAWHASGRSPWERSSSSAHRSTHIGD